MALCGWRADILPRGRKRVSIGDAATAEFEAGRGIFECNVRLPPSVHGIFPVRNGRDLAFVLSEIRARHFGYPVP